MPPALVRPSAQESRTGRYDRKNWRPAAQFQQQVITALKAMPKTALPMEVLRTATSMLSMYDSEAEDMSPEANVRKAIRLTAQVRNDRHSV